MSYTDEEAKAAWKIASADIRSANCRAERRARLAGYAVAAIALMAGAAAILKG